MKLKRLRITMISLITFLFTSLMVIGQPKTDLTPEDEYDYREDPREIVTKVKEQVEVRVGTDMWDGEEMVAKNVIPLKVTVDNANEDPIIVSYKEFDLENNDGREYSVMPLYKYDVDLDRLVLDKDFHVIPEPYYEQTNFYVYPFYEPAYSGIETTDFDYVLDPEIQQKYFLWNAMDKELPTQNMRMKALTEGVLDKDGIVSGYLYFEDVLPTDEKVTFNFDIVNANTGEKEATIKIPYYVE